MKPTVELKVWRALDLVRDAIRLHHAHRFFESQPPSFKEVRYIHELVAVERQLARLLDGEPEGTTFTMPGGY